MGLRRKGKIVIWRVCVPEELSVQAELFLASGSNRPQYGIRSQYVTELIDRDLATRGLKNVAQNLIPETPLPRRSKEEQLAIASLQRDEGKKHV